jgi:hypothetical protein
MKLKQTGRLAPANKPWKLIRDAIHDLALQERCKSVRIDMEEWHKPNGHCAQCLAGVAISRRLGADTRDVAHPYLSRLLKFQGRLIALDYFRYGDLDLAYHYLGIALPPGVFHSRLVERYEDDPAAFKRDMLELADTLEKAHKKP